MVNEIKSEIGVSKKWPYYDSCLNLVDIKKITADEVYRFIYYPSFCYQPIVVTLTRDSSNYNLHFSLFQHQKSKGCYTITSEFDKKLSSDNWDDLKTKLLFSDIWGLKTENGEKESTDGSFLIFSAFISDTTKHHYKDNFCIVYRKDFNSLRDPLTLALKLSGNTKGCYVIR